MTTYVNVKFGDCGFLTWGCARTLLYNEHLWRGKGLRWTASIGMVRKMRKTKSLWLYRKAPQCPSDFLSSLFTHLVINLEHYPQHDAQGQSDQSVKGNKMTITEEQLVFTSVHLCGGIRSIIPGTFPTVNHCLFTRSFIPRIISGVQLRWQWLFKGSTTPNRTSSSAKMRTGRQSWTETLTTKQIKTKIKGSSFVCSTALEVKEAHEAQLKMKTRWLATTEEPSKLHLYIHV